MLFKLHIVSDAPLSLHDTVDCDLSFENVPVLNSCMFLEDKGGIFPTEQIYLRCNQFPTLPAGLQRQAYLDSEHYKLEI